MIPLKDFLNQLPATEDFKHSAKLNAEIGAIEGGYTFEDYYSERLTKTGEQYTEYRWDDGGGQVATVIWFKQYTLVLVFDHESGTNFYGMEENDEENQLSLYENMPEELNQFVFNLPETYWLLNIQKESGDEIRIASGVAWNTGFGWEYASAWDDFMEQNLANGYQADDGGFQYCLSWFTQVQPLTVDNVEKYYADQGYDDDFGTMVKIRSIASRVLG